MNVSEYIINFLKEKGTDAGFIVTGGHSMHLNDALCRTPEIRPVFTHHEQAAAMSADAYARLSGKLGFAMVTAGPGAINAMNGLLGAYVDSTPVMIVSGQSNLNQTEYMYKTGIRQYGVQGIATRDLVEKGTKFFATVDDPAKVAYYLEQAYYMAFEGRPGPVWLEVPLNVQAMRVPEKFLYSFTPAGKALPSEIRKTACAEVAGALAGARRPLIMAGQGVRSAGVIDEFLELVERYGIPVVTTRLGIDIIEYEHPLFVGHPGNNGDRPANITVQNADVIIVLGSRMSTSSTGHQTEMFAEKASVFYIDVDQNELSKPGLNINTRIHDDLRYFLPALLNCELHIENDITAWAAHCRNLKYRYPVMQPGYKGGEKINSFYAIDVLSETAGCDDAVITDAGSVFHVTAQGWKIKKGQRFIASGGLSSMGYWCAVTGAGAAKSRGNAIVVTGEGSLQMNIQELATIRQMGKRVKIIVINNGGYLLIRQSQHNYMEDRFFGESSESGLVFPDLMAIAAAYGIKGVRIEKHEDLEQKLRETLDYDGPVLCEVICQEWQDIIPRVASDKMPDGTLKQRNFEDMYPYLPEDELSACMLCGE